MDITLEISLKNRFNDEIIFSHGQQSFLLFANPICPKNVLETLFDKHNNQTHLAIVLIVIHR
jgi:hypothetical protein